MTVLRSIVAFSILNNILKIYLYYALCESVNLIDYHHLILFKKLKHCSHQKDIAALFRHDDDFG